MARRRYETRDRGKLSELQREQIRTLRSKEERAAGLERGRDWISFRGTKVHSRGRTPRYFCVLPLIGHARIMTAGSLCRIRVSITRPKSTQRFPETRGHPPARQVLRSPNYQLIFVFTALRCTFVTLAEHDAASWRGKFNFVPPPSRRRCPMAKNSRLPKGPVELVRLDVIRARLALGLHLYHESLKISRIAYYLLSRECIAKLIISNNESVKQSIIFA